MITRDNTAQTHGHSFLNDASVTNCYNIQQACLFLSTVTTVTTVTVVTDVTLSRYLMYIITSLQQLKAREDMFEDMFVRYA